MCRTAKHDESMVSLYLRCYDALSRASDAADVLSCVIGRAVAITSLLQLCIDMRGFVYARGQ
jgi:hypothetical protein